MVFRWFEVASVGRRWFVGRSPIGIPSRVHSVGGVGGVECTRPVVSVVLEWAPSGVHPALGADTFFQKFSWKKGILSDFHILSNSRKISGKKALCRAPVRWNKRGGPVYSTRRRTPQYWSQLFPSGLGIGPTAGTNRSGHNSDLVLSGLTGQS